MVLLQCFLCNNMVQYLYFQARAAKRDGEFAEAGVLGKQARDFSIISIVLCVFLILVAVLIIVLLYQRLGFKDLKDLFGL